jgi:hypothetical protein
MTQLDLNNIMADLAKRRPVFHSEKDFQFELAWSIKEKFPSSEIRMERPYRDDRNMRCDIIVILDGKTIGIELKYVTCALDKNINGEHYILTNHAATPLRRYDYYADIERLESLKKDKGITCGYAIFLTNVNSYKGRTNGMGKSFDFSDNHKITDREYDWSRPINENSITRARNKTIKINATYECHWKEYSDGFDYIMLQI